MLCLVVKSPCIIYASVSVFLGSGQGSAWQAEGDSRGYFRSIQMREEDE